LTLLRRWVTSAWSLSGFEPNEQEEVHHCKLSVLKARACLMMLRSGVILSLASKSYTGWQSTQTVCLLQCEP
jgi:hypothetical protein